MAWKRCDCDAAEAMRIRPEALPKMVSCSSMLGITIYSTFHWLVDPDEADYCFLESGYLGATSCCRSFEYGMERGPGMPSTLDRR